MLFLGFSMPLKSAADAIKNDIGHIWKDACPHTVSLGGGLTLLIYNSHEHALIYAHLGINHAHARH